MPWFFNNRPQAEPVVAGGVDSARSIQCPNCQALNPAGSRFCNQCGHPFAAAGSVTDATAPTPVSGDLSPHVTASAPELDTAPTPAHQHVTGPLSQPNADERRLVTVLFADLANSTALADAMDPEELRMLLGGFFTLMADQIQIHGGIVEKFIGDAVMGVFGLPRTHEDDPVRAVRAALDMQSALHTFNQKRRALDDSAPELAMRIGINTGNVVATSEDDRRDFLVTGDPVNVAARLQQIANPGAVVVGQRTFRDVESAIEYRALPPADVKGKPRPLRVWEVLQMRDVYPVPLARTRNLERPSNVFIGRDHEMRLMAAFYDRAIDDRRPHVVTILGAPGVGKSRLAREFLTMLAERMPEPEVLIGRAALYGNDVTFWPLAEMLRDFCDITPATTPDEARALILSAVRQVLSEAGREEDPLQVARALGSTVGFESPAPAAASVPASTRPPEEDMLGAWRIFFEAIATIQPLVVLVDDLHWVDNDLLNLLESIAARSTNFPILLLGTARPDLLLRRPNWGSGKSDYLMLELEPLDLAQSAQLIDEALGGDPLPAEMQQNILLRGEGNPFFIEEIVRMLIERGVIIRSDDHWQVSAEWAQSHEALEPAIPDTVQGVLAARIDLLDPEEREVLRHAAIIGRSFWAGALLGMAPDLTRAGLNVILQNLLRKDLITIATNPTQGEIVDDPHESRYLFKHVLTRDVVYETMARARRAQEHEQFATWVETYLAADHATEYAELLAQHYEEYYRQSGLARSHDVALRQVVFGKVLGYLEQAGDGARARHAAQSAVRYYSRALVLLAEAGDDFAPAYRHTLLVLYVRRGDARAMQSDGDGAWRDYQAALQQWQQIDMATLAANDRTDGMRLYRRLVTLPTRYPSWFRHEPAHEELRTYLLAGLRLADEAGEANSLDRAALLTAKTFFWWAWPQARGQAQLLDALDSAEEAVHIAEQLDAPREASEALDALGNMEATVADLRGYLASQARRLFWARRISDPNELVDIHCEVSAAHQLVGEYVRAVEHGQIALEAAAKLENDVLRTQSHQRLVLAYFEWEHWPECIEHGAQLLTIGPRTPVTGQNHYRWGVLAYAIALLHLDRLEAAARIEQHLAELPPIVESQYVGVYRARLQLAQGKYNEAERTLRAAMEVRGGRYSYPALLAELSELGVRLDRDDIMREFTMRAVDIGERSGARKPLAQALRARGAVALRQERFTDARRDIGTALDQFESLGTSWEAARTHYLLAELWRRSPGATNDRSQHELTRALHMFEQMGAVRDANRVRLALGGGELRFI